MQDPEDALKSVKPGGVVSFEIEANKSHPVGTRFIIAELPRAADRSTPYLTDLLPAEAGPWQVVNVEPVPEKNGWVKMWIQLIGSR